jgi:hypothetical protein
MNDTDLRTEARVFARYIVGETPSEAIVERYRAANHALPAVHGDDEVVAYARQHPWSVSLLDAAAGLTTSGSLLRKKLLVMTAILETTPELVAKTEPRAVGLPQLAVRLGVAGVRTAFEVAAGLALSAVVKRRG